MSISGLTPPPVTRGPTTRGVCARLAQGADHGSRSRNDSGGTQWANPGHPYHAPVRAPGAPRGPG